MPRKGENIYKRKDGRWEARYIKGRKDDGKAIYGYVYGKNYREAREKRKIAVADFEVQRGKKQRNQSSITISELAEQWLTVISPQIKLSTYNKYRNLINSYVSPNFYAESLSDLSAQSLQLFCNRLLVSGGRQGVGLSPKTVSDILSVLRRLFQYGEMCGYSVKCTGKEFSIKQESKEITVLSKEEQEILCKYLILNPSERNLAILLCLFTGLRIGELCALMWDDISFSNSSIYIHQTIQRVQIEGNPDKKTKVIISTPKSKCSIRTIPVPDKIMMILKRADIMKDGYLVTGMKQKYIEPRTMENHFHRVLSAASLRNVNFHTLRHTFATRCVEAGFDIKSLSEILGHASVTTTMNRYVHPSMDLKRENMQRLSNLITVI